jgi:methionine synthase I (cobalamin-dependent)
MRDLLQDVIRERPLLGDGAMGTQLMLAGLEQGNCGEGAGDSTEICRGGVRVHHHEYIWRVADHVDAAL